MITFTGERGNSERVKYFILVDVGNGGGGEFEFYYSGEINNRLVILLVGMGRFRWIDY